MFFGGVINSTPNWIVMEYFIHGSLMDVLENKLFDISFQTMISLSLDIINGLDYLHKHCKISHGKLRSTNCLVISVYLLSCLATALKKFDNLIFTLTGRQVTDCQIIGICTRLYSETMVAGPVSNNDIIATLQLLQKNHAG